MRMDTCGRLAILAWKNRSRNIARAQNERWKRAEIMNSTYLGRCSFFKDASYCHGYELTFARKPKGRYEIPCWCYAQNDQIYKYATIEISVRCFCGHYWDLYTSMGFQKDKLLESPWEILVLHGHLISAKAMTKKNCEDFLFCMVNLSATWVAVLLIKYPIAEQGAKGWT
jgi:hypothetical protein